MEQIFITWNDYHSSIVNSFKEFYKNGMFVDVTLAADGKFLKAHKLVLSMCSHYFNKLFVDVLCEHPIIYFNELSFSVLTKLLQFMYEGEIKISEEELINLVEIGESLKIKGLDRKMNLENNQKYLLNCKEEFPSTFKIFETRVNKIYDVNEQNMDEKENICTINQLSMKNIEETVDYDCCHEETDKNVENIYDNYMKEVKRPFNCSWSECNKSYSRLSGLVRHTRVHTGEKNYVCPVCYKRFMRSDHVRNHIRRHPNIDPAVLHLRKGSYSPFFINGDSINQFL